MGTKVKQWCEIRDKLTGYFRIWIDEVKNNPNLEDN